MKGSFYRSQFFNQKLLILLTTPFINMFNNDYYVYIKLCNKDLRYFILDKSSIGFTKHFFNWTSFPFLQHILVQLINSKNIITHEYMIQCGSVSYWLFSFILLLKFLNVFMSRKTLKTVNICFCLPKMLSHIKMLINKPWVQSVTPMCRHFIRINKSWSLVSTNYIDVT